MIDPIHLMRVKQVKSMRYGNLEPKLTVAINLCLSGNRNLYYCQDQQRNNSHQSHRQILLDLQSTVKIRKLARSVSYPLVFHSAPKTRRTNRLTLAKNPGFFLGAGDFAAGFVSEPAGGAASAAGCAA
jgi:hypothetical protein